MTLNRTRSSPANRKGPSSVPTIDSVIHVIRGERVILDVDLAKIYGVETRALNQAIKRHAERFPSDFPFQLTAEEVSGLKRSQTVTAFTARSLRSQTVISNQARGGRRYLPYALTEHGAIMVANVLKSPRAVQMSVFVVRAFIKMRAAFAGTRELARKLASLEQELTSRLDSHESAIVDVLQRIMALLEPPPPPPEPPAKELGFHTGIRTSKNA